MRPSTRMVVLGGRKQRYSANLLPLNASGASGSGGAYNNWASMSLTGNTLTSIGAPFNAFYYRVNVKPNTTYRVTSPLPAQPISGVWDIPVSFSQNGSTLAGYLTTQSVNVTEFFVTTPSMIVSLEIIMRRRNASSPGANDTCLFYGFLMSEVL